jgi:hypothetical protein
MQAPPIRQMTSERHLSSGPPSSSVHAKQIEPWLSSLRLEQYLDRFVEMEVTADMLPHLDREHLQQLGVKVGHQITMMHSLHYCQHDARATLPSSRPQMSKLQILINGWFLGDVRAEDLSRAEVLEMNTQLAFILALIWFADVTYLLGIPSYMATAASRDQNWAKLAFGTAAVLVSIGTALTIQQYLFVLQVKEHNFREYMQQEGCKLQKLIIRLFLLGCWSLGTAYFFMQLCVLPWPFNIALTAIGSFVVTVRCVSHIIDMRPHPLIRHPSSYRSGYTILRLGCCSSADWQRKVSKLATTSLIMFAVISKPVYDTAAITASIQILN